MILQARGLGYQLKAVGRWDSPLEEATNQMDVLNIAQQPAPAGVAHTLVCFTNTKKHELPVADR